MQLKLRNKWLSFGCYLLCISIWQFYVLLLINNGEEWFFYLDPRIGLSAFGEQFIDIFMLFLIKGWWQDGWQLLPFFCLRESTNKTYIISEIILSAPSVVFVVSVILFGAAPSHGFGITELTCPVLIMLLTTVIPFVVIYSHKGSK